MDQILNVRNKVILSHVMQPSQANPAGNVHGGEIMKMMDTAAAAAATKYSKGNCVTARVDELQFHLPIFVGALVTCHAYIAYVGRTSMEVYVDVMAEDLESNSAPQKALSASFTMVAMGRNGRPQEINRPYIPETEDEKRLHEAVVARKNAVKK